MNASRLLYLLLAFTAANALAQQASTTNPAAPTQITIDGTTYTDFRWGRVTPATVTLFHKTGVATIPLEKLPPDLQQQFGYDPQRAAQWQAAQQAAEAEANKRAAESARQAADAARQAADAAQHAAAAIEWTLTIEEILPDGIIARGYKTSDDKALNPVSSTASSQGNGQSVPRVRHPKSILICLINYPKVRELAEGDKITATAYQSGVITIAGHALGRWVYFGPLLASSQPSVQQYVSASLSKLRQNGAFGFPQRDATMLWDQPALRVSVWNNDQYLFVQAVLWTVGGPAPANAANTEQPRDSSKLMLDLDANGAATPNLDRHYWLNRTPNLKGLYYQVSISANGRTSMKHDSQGRGAIRYVDVTDGKLARVDTYLIPLAELSKQVGDTIGLCYWGYSSQPPLTVSSIGYEAPGTVSHSDNFSFSKAAQYTLRKGAEIDVGKVPDGRTD
ncbi:MAG: hypothetical protein ABSH14_07495 [Verrucomicrobiia bacterium]|jgi:hypothetical protein